MTPVKQQISPIPFSTEKCDNTWQQIAEISIAAIVLSPISIQNGIGDDCGE